MPFYKLTVEKVVWAEDARSAKWTEPLIEDITATAQDKKLVPVEQCVEFEHSEKNWVTNEYIMVQAEYAAIMSPRTLLNATQTAIHNEQFAKKAQQFLERVTAFPIIHIEPLRIFGDDAVWGELFIEFLPPFPTMPALLDGRFFAQIYEAGLGVARVDSDGDITCLFAITDGGAIVGYVMGRQTKDPDYSGLHILWTDEEVMPAG